MLQERALILRYPTLPVLFIFPKNYPRSLYTHLKCQVHLVNLHIEIIPYHEHQSIYAQQSVAECLFTRHSPGNLKDIHSAYESITTHLTPYITTFLYLVFNISLHA